MPDDWSVEVAAIDPMTAEDPDTLDAARERPNVISLHVTIDDQPIRVWIYDGAGEADVQHIRVVGHATEEVCRKASIAIAEATASPHLSGFFSYGVADLVATDALGKQELTTLAAVIQALAETKPDEVDVHHVSMDSDVDFTTLPVLPARDSDVALVGQVGDSLPPAFVPVRVWDGKSATTASPLELTFTPKDLGLTQAQLKRLSGDVGLAPWIDAIALLNQDLTELQNYLTWIQRGKQIDRGVGGLKPEIRARDDKQAVRTAIAAAQRVGSASNALREFQRVMKRLGKPGIVEEKSLQDVLDLAVRVERTDSECLRYWEECDSYVAVTIPPPTAGISTLIDAVLASATPENAASVKKEIVNVRAELEKARKAVAAARKGVQLSAKRARESLVDALLRGWPASMATEADTNTLIAVINKQIPNTWRKTLGTLAGRGVVLTRSDPAAIGGDLLGPSIFYAVREDSAGVFHVTPTYIVHGKYSEVWSSQRHTVTVEQPHD